MALSKITFTGADAKTDYPRLMEMIQWWNSVPDSPHSTPHPEVKLEFAFLINGKPDESRNRFHHPNKATVTALQIAGADVALHVCGGLCREVMEKGWYPISFRRFNPWLESAPERVQLNAPRGTLANALSLSLHARDGMNIRTVVQMNKGNQEEIMRRVNSPEDDCFDVLYDQSGGHGKGFFMSDAIAAMDQVPDTHLHGYAGGIGPANVRGIVQQLDAHYGTRPYFIDMESSLRDSDDWFDIRKVQDVLNNILYDYSKP